MMEINDILLVEDSQNDVELILESLHDFNLANRVTAVKDGIEALEYLQCSGKYKSRRRNSPAVILLDIKMPRMDGIELLRILKQDEQLKLIPIVILTSSNEEPDLKKCYELGANAYVVKPVKFGDFIETVKSIGIFWALLNELPADTGDCVEK